MSAPLAPAGLTELELEAIETTVQLVRQLVGIVGRGDTRAPDMDELFGHVHAIQQAIMSQAAARAYPDLFRLLGEVIKA